MGLKGKCRAPIIPRPLTPRALHSTQFDPLFISYYDTRRIPYISEVPAGHHGKKSNMGILKSEMPASVGAFCLLFDDSLSLITVYNVPSLPNGAKCRLFFSWLVNPKP
jgi:hypothetical protein